MDLNPVFTPCENEGVTNQSSLLLDLNSKRHCNYRPPTKLWEGNVFTRVCQSVCPEGRCPCTGPAPIPPHIRYFPHSLCCTGIAPEPPQVFGQGSRRISLQNFKWPCKSGATQVTQSSNQMATGYRSSANDMPGNDSTDDLTFPISVQKLKPPHLPCFPLFSARYTKSLYYRTF